MNVYVSSVGTSLLTNSAPRPLADELRVQANVRDEADYPADMLRRLRSRVREVRDEVLNGTVLRRRQLSAELNGLHASANVADESWPARDQHYLVSTDTVQGRATAGLIEEYLRSRGAAAEVVTPQRLSTHSQSDFFTGLQNLVQRCGRTLPAHPAARQRVVFNLVGGFKSLQGCMTTIGMLHADEIVYIFESEGAPPIRIPRMPLVVDTGVLRANLGVFSRMAANVPVPVAELTGVPSAMWEEFGDGTALMSAWGHLLWEAAAEDILATKLLDLPRLRPSDRFRKEFAAFPDAAGRVEMQRRLLRVAELLHGSNGDTRPLKADHQLQYDNYAGRHSDIGHFRATASGQGSYRVSCTAPSGGELLLLRFGGHDDVNDSPV